MISSKKLDEQFNELKKRVEKNWGVRKPMRIKKRRVFKINEEALLNFYFYIELMK